MQIELSARQIDAIEELHGSSKRIEFASWVLIVSSALLLLATIILLAVTVNR